MHELLDALRDRGLSLAVAEGDTGGLLLELLSAVPGSSAVLRGGVVAYHDDLKREVLSVEPAIIERCGAVSAAAAEAMAHGVRRLARTDVGLATTGIAGPGGATPNKPVGLAYIAAVTAQSTLVREQHWTGDRQANRQASAEAALALTLDLLNEHPQK